MQMSIKRNRYRSTQPSSFENVKSIQLVNYVDCKRHELLLKKLVMCTQERRLNVFERYCVKILIQHC